VWVRTVSAAVGKFSTPTAIVGFGVDLFIANRAGSVSEIDARTGSLVRLIAGARYGFSSPTALAVHGADLLALNAGGSVTEIAAATGVWVRTIAGARYGFDHPAAMVVASGQAWVTNSHGNSVTEFDATSGAWIRTLTNSAYQLKGPARIAFDGTKLWAADNLTAKITVIVAATGALSRVLSAAAPGPAPVAVGDSRVYVASPAGGWPMVTAYSAGSAGYQWMMCNTNGPCNFINPQALFVVGTVLWVANTSGNSLTEMNASTGAYLRRVA
jgi:DNA-binding beta-propeller fold protein YncE